MNRRIEYLLASNLEYDEINFEVWVDGELFVEVVDGVPLTVRVYPRSDGEAWVMSVGELEVALSRARTRLQT